MRELFAPSSRNSARIWIMYRARSDVRAKPWNWCARHSACRRTVIVWSRGLPKFPLAIGKKFTIPQLHTRDPERIAAREHDKWHFVPPGGGRSKIVSNRVSEWYDSLTRDTVAVAHGGTALGLMAHLGIAKPAAAPLVDIAQGVVYVFEGKQMVQYA